MPKIPSDILQEIFKRSFSSPLQAHQPSLFPWYLGHVCSRWRALFFSMCSTFWNRIEIDWYDDYGGLREQEFARLIEKIVAFFLNRTRGAPFSFVFCMEEGYLDQEAHHLRPILENLLAHSEQWEEVSVQLLSSELECLCSAKGRLPQLKKLEIIVEKDVDYRLTRRTIPSMVTNVFEDAPLLARVVLWDSSDWQFRFNWASLTIISFQMPQNSKNILTVLREAINLVELTVDDTSLEESLDIKGGELIHLPRLERLSIDDVELLTILQTPALQRLKISDCGDDDSEASIIVAFLRRSGIKLSTLVIHHVRAATVKEILQCLPKVDKLALLYVPGIADVFKWLAGIATQELRFSNLIVSWPDSTHVPEDLGALRNMIACRRPLGDGKHPNPEVVIETPKGGQSKAANLKSLCRDRGIRFGFIEEMSTLPWGVDLYASP